MRATGDLPDAGRPAQGRRDWPALMMRIAYATYLVLAVFVLLTIAVSLADVRVRVVPRALLALALSAAGVALWSVYRRRTP
jgi:hypothetical protein